MPVKIFLSYCHKNKNIADRIDEDFRAIGITFHRDDRDVQYGDSFKQFMGTIARSNFVILLISDEYLRSRSCMYELIEVLNTPEMIPRVLAILLEDKRNIFDAEVREEYYDFWRSEKAKIIKQLKRHNNEDYGEEKKEILNINQHIPQFFRKLKDMKSFHFKSLKEQFYKPMLETVGFKDKYLVSRLIAVSKIDDYEEQELALDKLLFEFPGNEFVLCLKGNCCERQNLDVKARDCYEQVLRINPANVEACNNLGIICARKFKEYEKSRTYLKKAIRIAPRHIPAYYNLAFLLEDHFSDFEGARHCYEKILSLDQDDGKAHFNLGNLLKKGFSDAEGARFHLEKALEVDPSIKGVHYSLAILFASGFNDNERSKQHFEKALEENTESVNVQYDYAIFLQSRLKDFDGARRHLIKVTQIDPRDGKAYYVLGKLLAYHFKEYDLARSHFERAIEIDQQDSNSHLELSYLLLFHYKDAENGGKHMEIAFRLDPSLVMKVRNEFGPFFDT
jgi:tetratricopeptide (TPR) repeat protein